jgi:hypothetical protein
MEPTDLPVGAEIEKKKEGRIASPPNISVKHIPNRARLFCLVESLHFGSGNGPVEHMELIILA